MKTIQFVIEEVPISKHPAFPFAESRIKQRPQKKHGRHTPMRTREALIRRSLQKRLAGIGTFLRLKQIERTTGGE